MRLFIAIPISDDVRVMVERAAQDLARLAQSSGADIHWVRPEQYHFTLKFLGEVPESRVAEIKETLRDAVRGTNAFSVTLQGLGSFPPAGAPRLLWVGVQQGSEPLGALASVVDAACQPFTGGAARHAYKAHVTIGRVRKSGGLKPIREVLKQRALETFGTMGVTGVELMRSVLHPRGPEYSILDRAMLTK